MTLLRLDLDERRGHVDLYQVSLHHTRTTTGSTIESINAKWQDHQLDPVTSLVIIVERSDDVWDQLCDMIQSRFPNLQSLSIQDTGAMPAASDTSIATLLQHVPKNLRKLKLANIMCPIPLAFQQIGQFQQLQLLRIGRLKGRCGGHGGSLQDFEQMTAALGALPSLQRLIIRDWQLENPTACWELLSNALASENKSKNQLVKVDISQNGLEAMVSTRIHTQNYQISQDLLSSFQYWPRVNEAKKKIYNGNLDEWLQTMVAVNDRFECFHILFAKISPGDWLPAELLGDTYS